MTILYFDAETTINNRGEDAIGKHEASPFHPDNRMVWIGWKWEGPTEDVWTVKERHKRRGRSTSRWKNAPQSGHCSMLVAQNVSFDLEHLMMEDPRWRDWAFTKGKLWDVQIVEYLITGQQTKWADLDSLSIKYGGTVKDNRMKEYWKAGVCTSDIPDDEIQPYLKGDVSNLEIIYKKQLEKVKELGMLALVESQMDARLATIVMEYNGMYFDKDIAEREAVSLRAEYDVIESGCKAALAVLLSPMEEDEINPNSNAQVGAALFGGTIKVDRKQVCLDEEGMPIKYKSGIKKGQTKYKKVKEELSFEGMYKSTSPIGANGCFPVGTDIIKKLGDTTGLVENILKLREYKKQISTYFEGYAQLVFPDGCLHGSLNHCQTNTGRLSSSAPNLQNISGKTSGE